MVAAPHDLARHLRPTDGLRRRRRFDDRPPMATKKTKTTAAASAPLADAAATLAPVKPKTKKTKAAPTTTVEAPAPPSPAKPAKKPKPTHPALTGKRLAFFGKFSLWPGYHHAQPATVAKRYGAVVVDALDDSVDVVVFGDLSGAGKTDAWRKAAKLQQKAPGKLQVLDEGAYRELVRIDLTGKRFAFAGGFDISPDEANDGVLRKMAERLGAVVDDEINADLDWVVEGARRGDKKQARLNQVKKLIADGAEIAVIDERDFLLLVRTDQPTAVGGSTDFAGFMAQLYTVVDQGKLGRALKMLKAESFKHFTPKDESRLVGVVKSQTGSGDVYAPWIASNGQFGCCNQELDECRGLGGVCKHLLVVVVGLVRTSNMNADQALAWLKAAQSKIPKMDKDGCAAIFIQYKGAEAGTIDWRPTETLPEDFMAL
jgi:BRCT domain type II-containing protein